MISYIKGWYNGIFPDSLRGDRQWRFFYVCVCVLWKWGQLMEIRSHCCLTVGTFAVIACVINLWDERRQAPPTSDALRITLKNCCYEWHSGLMNMNTFIKIGTGSPPLRRLGVTVALAGHGWWEGTAVPGDGGCSRDQTNNLQDADLTFRTPPKKNLRLLMLLPCVSIYSPQTNKHHMWKLVSTFCYVPAIILRN